MTPQQIRASVLSLLGQGNLDAALQSLLEALHSGGTQANQDQALMLKAQWETLKQDQIKGLLSRSEYELAQNKVIAGIQNVVNQLENPSSRAVPSVSSPSTSRLWLYLAALLALLILAFLGYRFSRPKQALTKASIEQIEPQKKVPESQVSSTVVPKEPLKNKPIVGKMPAEQKAHSTNPSPRPIEDKPAPKWVEVKVILTKGDVQLKIDGEMPNYLSTSTGMVRTVRITEGKHKFEITENGAICTLPQTILSTTQKIFPTCK